MGCCISLSGITRNCENSIGGIRRAWAACYDDAGTPKIVNGEVTELPKPAAWTPEYEFRKQTGSVTQTITRDDATGTLYYSSDIVLQFTRQEMNKRLEIVSIAASDTCWIIEDNNRNWWYFGYYYPVTLTDGSAETGTSFGDFNGYSITLNAMEKTLAYPVKKDVITKLGVEITENDDDL